MLTEISTALESTGKKVFYGRAGNLEASDLWDYIVFYRRAMNTTGNKKGLADRFTVAIVQEEYVEDELVYDVISAVEAIPGIRLADGEHQYQYTTKPNTETVIEMLLLDFVKPKKRCNNG